jgi:hypothetical protein
MAKGAQYFPSGMARMNTQAGIRARLFGVREVRAALNAKLLAIKAGTMEGLLIAAAHIKNDMEVTPPVIPVDTGSLRAAFKIEKFPEYRITKAGARIDAVQIGWPDTQIQKTDPKTGKSKMVDNYAAYVHEMTSPPYGDINWSRPNSGPKFFEYALKRNAPVIVQIIKQTIGPTI